ISTLSRFLAADTRVSPKPVISRLRASSLQDICRLGPPAGIETEPDAELGSRDDALPGHKLPCTRGFSQVWRDRSGDRLDARMTPEKRCSSSHWKLAASGCAVHFAAPALRCSSESPSPQGQSISDNQIVSEFLIWIG